MLDLCKLIFGTVIDLLRSRATLEAEILVLRQQINVLRRASPKRLQFGSIDRLILGGVCRLFPARAFKPYARCTVKIVVKLAASAFCETGCRPRGQFDAARSFDVIGCDSGKRYRIYYGTAMNVHEIDDAGRPKVCWCFVSNGQLVAGDVMLAQKIALETKEFSALAVANQFRPKVEPRTRF